MKVTIEIDGTVIEAVRTTKTVDKRDPTEMITWEWPGFKLTECWGHITREPITMSTRFGIELFNALEDMAGLWLEQVREGNERRYPCIIPEGNV